MSYLVLPRKYRPQTFDDMVGQDGVATTLKNAIVRDRVAHAYLFAGSRGTGKTSMARIFAKALNCPNAKGGVPCNECDVCRSISSGGDVDVIEIDGASNNKVDEVRVLRENVRYVPQRSKYKIYIIDEVHMLSNSAFNALLKTLEEPPEHVKFIFATTESHKLPETIHSRCQRFDFHRITPKAISKRLEEIAEKENIKTEPGLIDSISTSTRGGLRDAVSLLDQLASFSAGGEITLDELNQVLGRAGTGPIAVLFKAVADSDAAAVLEAVDGVFEKGLDITEFVAECVRFARNVLMLNFCTEKSPLADAIRADIDKYKEAAGNFSNETLLYIIESLSALRQRIRWATEKRTPVEAAFIKLARMKDMARLDELMARIERVEKAFSSGSVQLDAGKKKEPERPSMKSIRMEDVSGRWSDFCGLVESRQKGVRVHLLGARYAGFDGNTATIVVTSALQRDELSRPKACRAVEETLSEAAGRPVKIRIETAPDAEKTEKDDHPLVKKISEDFNARILER